jgi:hypothetical protein
MSQQTEKRSRWQLTTRSRFALVLGLAGLAVAGVQVAMLSDPPTVVQIVVVAFWGLVGFGYLSSAAMQRLRGSRETPPAPPVAAPADEIVPVPVRPARPRPRREASQEQEAAKVADRAPRTEVARTSAVPAGAPAREGRVPRDREGVRAADRASRTEVRPAARPEPARPEPARTAAVRPEPVRPEPARTASVRPEPVRPEPARTTAVPRAVPTTASPAAARRSERPAPAPIPVPEPTTVAFRPRSEPRPSRPPTRPESRPDSRPESRPPSRPASRPEPAVPATAMLGHGTSLSFGAAAEPTATALDPLDPSTPVPALALPADVAPAPRNPSPISGPLPTAGARTFGDASRSAGRRHAAASSEAPEPRRPRHQADVEDPVAARRGRPDPASGRHATVGSHSSTSGR